MKQGLLHRALSLLLGAIMIVAMMPINIFAEQKTVDLNPEDVEIIEDFKINKYDNNGSLIATYTLNDDEIAIRIKKDAWNKYYYNKIKIPREIDGKKVVALGSGFVKTTAVGGDPSDYTIPFPDLSEVKDQLKYIDDGAFTCSILEDEIVLEGFKELKYIGNSSFTNWYGKNYQLYSFWYGRIRSLTLKDLPKLDTIGYEAFGDCSIENLTLENLPQLKSIGDTAFCQNKLKSLDLSKVPSLETLYFNTFANNQLETINFGENSNLKEIGIYVFARSKLSGDLDLRNLKKLQILNRDSFTWSPDLKRIMVQDPPVDFDNFMGFDADQFGYTTGGAALHRITYTYKANEGQLPQELKKAAPAPFGIYIRDKQFDPDEFAPFKTWTNQATGDVWELGEWKTDGERYDWNDFLQYHEFRRGNIYCTGVWSLQYNKKALEEALKKAHDKKKDVVTSGNGEDIPPEKKWVTPQDQKTFDEAIKKAQDIYDGKLPPDSAGKGKQAIIDEATNELNKAIEAYNPQNGKPKSEKNRPGGGSRTVPQSAGVSGEKAAVNRDTVIKKGYIFGYPDGTFHPDGSMTRAEAAAMFARLADLNTKAGAVALFSDVENHWAKASIDAMVSAGYMKGYPDGTFRPDGKISRAEFAQMIKAMDKANSARAPFKDIEGHWAQAAIAQAYGNGRIKGYPDGTFRPNNEITRAEAVTMFNNLYNRKVDAKGLEQVLDQILDFKDVSRDNWAYFNIVAASNTAEVYYVDKNKNDETWVRVIQNWKQAQANQ